MQPNNNAWQSDAPVEPNGADNLTQPVVGESQTPQTMPPVPEQTAVVPPGPQLPPNMPLAPQNTPVPPTEPFNAVESPLQTPAPASPVVAQAPNPPVPESMPTQTGAQTSQTPRTPWQRHRPAAFMSNSHDNRFQDPAQSPLPPTSQPSPFQTQPEYANPNTAAGTTPYPPKRSMVLLIFVVLALFMLIGGGAFAYLHFGRVTPDSVFQAALENSLALQQQKLTLQTQGVTATIQYDMSKSKDPRASEDIALDLLGSNIETDNYSSKQNDYILFKHLGSSTGDKQFAALLNKWVQLKKDGNAVSGSENLTSIVVSTHPNLADVMTGTGWPLGNFSANDRKTLVEYVNSNQIFAYDAKKVTKAQVNGEQAYVYSVTLNKSKLRELIKKELALWGFSSSEIDQAVVANSSDSTDTKLYIGTHSKHMLKMTDKSGTDSETATFAYKDVAFPGEPKAQITVQQLISAFGTNDTTGTGDTADGGVVDVQAKDAERKADITSLAARIEEYANNNEGQYPTPAQMLDAAWVAKNLTDLDPASLKDPDGTSSSLAAKPTAKQYSFQAGEDENLSGCDNNSTTCLFYKVTAILSNGTQYSQPQF